MIDEFDREIASLASCSSDPAEYLDADEQLELLRVAHPSFKDNPFNRQVRYRNYAIVYLLLVTGVRRGELLKLRLEDINFDLQTPSITIHIQDERDESERYDTRGRKPRQKTRGRRIPITDGPRGAIVAYLRNERSTSATSPFLFLSSRRNIPLAETAVNNLFHQINRAFPDELRQLKPHLMRHTFNANFKIHNLKANLKGDQLSQVQNYLNGWKDGSVQGAKYGGAVNYIISQEYIKKMNEGLDGKLNLRTAI